MHDVDAVVVGSGAGGLACALALAQAGQRVLVLEQHYVPGGWCHSFKLDRFRFSPGVHYVGELGEGGRMRRIYAGLGVGHDLTFLELNPDGYERVIVGEQRFDVPRGYDRYAERLCARFPGEAEGIRRYFAECNAIRAELHDRLALRMPWDLLKMPFVAPRTTRYANTTMARFLDGFVKDPFLREILCTQGGDYGLPARDAPVTLHAAVCGHYADGAYYPRGGGSAIAQAFVRGLKRAGGVLRLRTSVERILLERGRAIGVRLADGTEVRARHVVSNADPEMTYRRLIGEEHLGWRLRRKLRGTRYSAAAVSLFAATSLDLESAGFDSGNIWYTRSLEGPGLMDFARQPNAANHPLPGAFITITSLKDRTKFDGRHHTVEAFVFLPYDAFAPYAGSRFGERPAAYDDLKARLHDKLVQVVDEVIPGFATSLVFSELGTPLTNAHYVAAHQGNVYGIEKTGRQIGPWSYPVTTPFRHLYMCGASTVAHGVMGATVSGLMAAAAILGCGFKDLLTRNDDITIAPCDDPSAWPEALRGKMKATPRQIAG